MKRIAVAVMCVLGVLAGADRAFASDALKAVVASYLDIQSQLVNDKMDTVKTQAHAIGQEAGRMGAPGADIVKAAGAVEKSTDLKTARDSFATLSDAVIAAAKAEGWKDVGDLKLAWCPMVKRSWLQKDEKIQNPYFGKSMPTCGEFKKTQ